MVEFRLAKADFLRTIKNPKTWVVLLLCYFFFWNETVTLRALGEANQMGVAPYVYPIFMTDWRSRMYALVLVLLMLGEAPYYNGAEVFTSMRISTLKWFISKVVYIFMVSIFFQVFMMIISVVACLPYVGFSAEWGDIITTYINSIQGAISATGIVKTKSIMSLEPQVAMVQEFVLMVLTSVLLALIIFIINATLKNMVGTILIGSVVIIDLYLNEFASRDLMKWDISYFLPSTWVDMNTFAVVDWLSFEKCTLYLTLIIVALITVGCVLVKKKIIRPIVKV